MARYQPKEGFVQLWRRLRDHRFWPTYKRRRFTELEAWIDLLFDATFKAHQMRFRGHTFNLKPGELVFSQNDRADRWRWSRSKVRSFLEELYLNGEASHEVIQGITRVKIHKLTGCAEWQPDNGPKIDRSASRARGEEGGRREEEGEVQDLKPLSSNKVQVLVQGVLDKIGKGKKKGSKE